MANGAAPTRPKRDIAALLKRIAIAKLIAQLKRRIADTVENQKLSSG